MIVSKPPLQACRTCEHGRKLLLYKVAHPYCGENHQPTYAPPSHEHDDQHGFHRHCADFVMREEIIDADEEDCAPDEPHDGDPCKSIREDDMMGGGDVW